MKSVFYLMILALSLWSFKSENLIGYSIGDKATDFELVNAASAVNGTAKKVSLSSYTNAKGFIVIFTCNHCPFSKAYEDRIIALQSKYEKKGFHVIAINPNDAVKEPEDSFEAMKERAAEKKFNFPYLHDETQEIAQMYGAKKTPHVFVLDESLTVQYIGAIDDNTDNPKEKYVENVVNELLKGQKVSKPSTRAIGCTIKWKG